MFLDKLANVLEEEEGAEDRDDEIEDDNAEQEVLPHIKTYKEAIVALDDVELQQKGNIEEAMSLGLTTDVVCKCRNAATVQPLQTYILVSTEILSLRLTYLVYSIHSILLSPANRLCKLNHAITNLMCSKTFDNIQSCMLGRYL